jgi:hypothetical protein
LNGDRVRVTDHAGLPRSVTGEADGDRVRRIEGDCAMSEPSSGTHAAGEGLSDEEMAQRVADQTASDLPENADKAGKDWNGDPGSAPAPTE